MTIKKLQIIAVTLQDLTDKKYLTLTEAERETGFGRDLIEAFMMQNRIPMRLLYGRYRIVSRVHLELMSETLQVSGPKRRRRTG